MHEPQWLIDDKALLMAEELGGHEADASRRGKALRRAYRHIGARQDVIEAFQRKSDKKQAEIEKAYVKSRANRNKFEVCERQLKQANARIKALEDECWKLSGKPTRCPVCRTTARRTDAGFSFQEISCPECGRTSGRLGSVEEARRVFASNDAE